MSYSHKDSVHRILCGCVRDVLSKDFPLGCACVSNGQNVAVLVTQGPNKRVRRYQTTEFLQSVGVHCQNGEPGSHVRQWTFLSILDWFSGNVNKCPAFARPCRPLAPRLHPGLFLSSVRLLTITAHLPIRIVRVYVVCGPGRPGPTRPFGEHLALKQTDRGGRNGGVLRERRLASGALLKYSSLPHPVRWRVRCRGCASAFLTSQRHECDARRQGPAARRRRKSGNHLASAAPLLEPTTVACRVTLARCALRGGIPEGIPPAGRRPQVSGALRSASARQCPRLPASGARQPRAHFQVWRHGARLPARK